MLVYFTALTEIRIILPHSRARSLLSVRVNQIQQVFVEYSSFPSKDCFPLRSLCPLGPSVLCFSIPFHPREQIFKGRFARAGKAKVMENSPNIREVTISQRHTQGRRLLHSRTLYSFKRLARYLHNGKVDFSR